MAPQCFCRGKRLLAHLLVTSDASGSWGCGAIHNTSWFQLAWPLDLASKPIHCKELVPIVGAASFGAVLGIKTQSCSNVTT